MIAPRVLNTLVLCDVHLALLCQETFTPPHPLGSRPVFIGPTFGSRVALRGSRYHPSLLPRAGDEQRRDLCLLIRCAHRNTRVMYCHALPLLPRLVPTPSAAACEGEISLQGVLTWGVVCPSDGDYPRDDGAGGACKRHVCSSPLAVNDMKHVWISHRVCVN